MLDIMTNYVWGTFFDRKVIVKLEKKKHILNINYLYVVVSVKLNFLDNLSRYVALLLYGKFFGLGENN